MKGLKRYLQSVSLLTTIVFLLSLAFSVFAPAQLVSRVLVFIPLFFFIVSVSTQFLLFSSGKHDQRKLAQVNIAVSGLRFVLYLITVVVYAFFFPGDSVPFLISFFIVYLFYAVFDAVWNYRTLKFKTRSNPIESQKEPG
jgi:hypothetical protein